MLQANYPSLVSKVHGKTLGRITTENASKLLRKSLDECKQLIGARDDCNAIEYEKWAEIYHQVSVLITGEQRYTPYKLKLLLMPQLVKICAKLSKEPTVMRTRIFKSGQCEAEEDCITKTHYSSNCFFFILQGNQIWQEHTYFSKQCGRRLGRNQSYPVVFTNMSKNLEFPKIAVCEKRSSSLLLSGLRSHVLGTFGCTAAAVAAKKAKLNLAPQAMVEK